MTNFIGQFLIEDSEQVEIVVSRHCFDRGDGLEFDDDISASYIPGVEDQVDTLKYILNVGSDQAMGI